MSEPLAVEAPFTVPAGHRVARLPGLGLGVMVIGLAQLVVFGGRHAERLYAAWLVAFVLFLTIALGCLFFVLIHTAMNGSWGVVVRRIAENAAAIGPSPLPSPLSTLPSPWIVTRASETSPPQLASRETSLYVSGTSSITPW